MSDSAQRQPGSRPLFEELEGRVLYSADGLGGLDVALTGSEDGVVEASLLPTGRDAALPAQEHAAESAIHDVAERREIAFIDARVPDAQRLVDDLSGSTSAGRTIDVVLLDGDEDGIARITGTLAERGPVDAIHLVVHGQDGTVQLGATRLDSATLEERAGELRDWGAALAEDAGVLVHGDDLAATDAGRAMLAAFGDLTGADVAASDDVAAAAILGAGADREILAGDIESVVAFTADARTSWPGLLEIERDEAGASTAADGLVTSPAGTVSAGIDIILIDTTLADYRLLSDAALEGAHVVLYNGDTESAASVLARALELSAQTDRSIDSLSIMAHGRDGEFKLGNDWIGAGTLGELTDAWQALDAAMNDGGNLYLFGCNVASDADGFRALLDGLAAVTGSDVFASNDLTGAGGDWELEAASTGDELERLEGLVTPFESAALEDYDATLAAPVTTADAVNTYENTAIAIDVLANDSDPDTDPLTARMITGPSNGTLIPNAVELTNETNLTNDINNDREADWSPDGSKIVFRSDRGGNNDIWVMDADGSNPVQLTSDPDFDSRPVWSPDGTEILFTSDRSGDEDIWIMNADGSGETNLTHNALGDDAAATWSPDGSQIAFKSTRDGNDEIYVMNADGTGQVNITNDAAKDSGASWSPDGSQILFVSDRGVSTDVWVMDANGSNPINLTDNPTGTDSNASWSADGSKIVFKSNRDGGNNEIYVMNGDGSNPIRLTDNTFVDGSPNWSPDGSQIIFQTSRDGNHEIYIGEILADGNFTYTPDAGFSGVDSFTYVASDGVLESALTTVTITTELDDGGPFANDETVAIDENTANSTSVTTVGVTGATGGNYAEMYWVDKVDDAIYKANTDGIGGTTTVLTGINAPVGLAVDYEGGKLYWTNNQSGSTSKIQSANLDGTGVTDLVTGLVDPDNIALDLINSKMYWTDDGDGQIRRANLDGTDVETLVSGLTSAQGIALDVVGGKMYWTDYGTNKIQRANLDGTDTEDLITGLTDPDDVELDLVNDKMYWIDFGAATIQRANLDGSDIEDLITSGLSAPYYLALDVPAGKMYWTDDGSNKIQRANLDGSGGIEDLVITGTGDPRDLALGAPSTLSFSITAGNTGDAFSIDADTGEIIVADSAALDFETTPTFNLTVEVLDVVTLDTDTATITINLNNVDDPLVVATTGNAVLFTEDAGATGSLFAAAIDTVESGDTVTQLVLTLANVEAGDTLLFGATAVDLNSNGATGPDANGFTYTVSSAGATPVVTIGHAGAADTLTNTMLNSLVFDNTTNDDPGTTARTVTLISVTDSGSGLTADGTVATVNVAKADDLLVVGATGNTVLFTEDAGPTSVLFAATIDTVEAGDTISQVVLTLANVEAGDLLRFGATTVDLNTNGATGPDASGFIYTVSSAGASPVVTITHAGASDTATNAMLNSLVFDNTTNEDPGTTARTVTLTSVTDSGSGLTNDGAVATVNVAQSNDAPTFIGDSVGYWHFDEGTGDTTAETARGVSTGTLGSSNGADANDPTWTAGHFGQALHFDGVDDYVEVADHPGIDVSGPQFAASLWMKPDAGPNQEDMLFMKGDRQGDINYYLSWKDSGEMTWAFKDSAGWHYQDMAVTLPTTGEWNHVAVSFDRPTVTLYVNGTKYVFDDIATGGSMDRDLTATDDPLWIGAGRSGGAIVGVNQWSGPFTGSIDDLALFGNALTDADVHAIRTSGPSAATATSFALDENSPNTTVVGSVVATDPDTSDTLSYAITNGNTGGAFSIDTNGQITVANSAALDFETNPVFNLTIEVTDDGAPNLSDTTVVTVELGPVNDALDVATTGNTVTFTEDAGATTSLFAAAMDTVEAADTISQVVLTLANVEAGDTLSFGATTVDLSTDGVTGPDANGFTYTVSSAGASPVVTISHAGADDATVNTMLNSAAFDNTSNDDPSTAARTVTLTSVTDSGTGLTADGTVATVNVATADDALSVATTGNTVTFTEDAGATTSLFAAAIDTVEAGDTVSQVVLTLANVEAGDLLRFGATIVDLNTDGATGPDANGFTYTVSSAGASPVVTITHAGASDTVTSAMLNSAAFDNTSNDDPSTTARTVTLTSVTDSGSGLTADGTVATVNVAVADDALNVATTGNTVTFTEGAGATTALFAAAIDAIEAGDTISQVVLTLANVEAGDLLRFGATTVDLNTNGASGPDANGFTYTVSSAGASPVVTITHAGASDTAVNAMLSSAAFDNTSNDDPSTTARTVTLTSVTDSGSGLTADGTVATVNVAASNNAPTSINNTGLTAAEGSTTVITNTDLRYTDAEQPASSLVYNVTASPANGQLELSTDLGTEITTFTQAQVDAGEVVYVHDGSETTSDGFAFTVDDGQGSYANGPSLVGLAGLANVTNGTTDANHGDWSPDGTKLLFSRDNDIHVINADGTNEIQLTSDPGGDFQAVWSPDGTKIAFATNRDGNSEIYVMNADGSNQLNVSIAAGNDDAPAWSPDGTQIAFKSIRDGDKEIFVMDADGSNQIQLTSNTAVDGGPEWSPDGSKIIFQSTRDSNHELYVMDANGANQTRLTNNTSLDALPDWSPDGTKILFYSDRDSNNEIYVMDANGSNQVRLTNNTDNDLDPVWSPDGAHIAFSSDRDGNFDIYTASAVYENTFAIAVNPVDDALSVATTGNTVTFIEDAGATTALFAAAIDTVEAGDTVSQVALTLANVEAGDLLRFGATTVDLNTNGATGPDANGFTYTVSGAGVSPVVTITHAGATDTATNATLNSAVFDNTSNDDPSTTTRTVTLTSVTDSGSGLTADGTVATVNVSTADDALDVATTGNTVTFTEDAGATSALFAAAIDTVEAGDTVSQVALTLANVEAGDLLRFGATTVDLNTNGATGPDGSGFTYTVSSAGASPVVTITHAGASDTAANTMLNSAVFNNTANNDPSTTARTVTLTSVTDSGSGLTADGTVATVNVATADDALSVATTGNTVTFTEDAGATTALFAATIDTVETGDTISQVVLTLANVEAGDLLRFGATTVDLNTNGATGPGANGFTYTVSSAGASPVVAITHAGSSDAAANAMLNSAVFDNTSNDNPSTTARTVTLTSVTDSGSGLTADGTVATVGIVVSAPEITARETVDSDADGQIDHIRFTTDVNLDDDFSGLAMTVSDYTVTGYVTNIGAGGSNDNVFYAQLTESGVPDTGATPTITVIANTSLSEFGNSNDIATEVPAGWWDSDWQSRQKLTFDNTNSAENLTDFPVLVRLDSSNVDFAKLEAGGADIRFVDAVGAPLAYEIESWDDTPGSESATVWVKVQQIDAGSNTDFIWVYYDNAAAADAQNASGVWDANYAGVWHLGEDVVDEQTTGSHVDSTGANDGVQSGNVEGGGKIGDAQVLDGADDFVNLGSNASITDVFAGGGTVSAWINPTGWGENGYGRIFDKADATLPGAGWALELSQSGQRLLFQQGFSGAIGSWLSDTNTISLGAWQQVTVTYDSSAPGNVPLFYIDGALVSHTLDSTPTGTMSGDAGVDLHLGNFSGATTRTFDGPVDEARISATARSADWIEASYLSQNGVFAFTNFGGEDSLGVVAIDKAGPVLLSATALDGGAAGLFDHTLDQLDLVFSESISAVPTEGDSETDFIFSGVDGDNLPTEVGGDSIITLETTAVSNDTIRYTFSSGDTASASPIIPGSTTIDVNVGGLVADAIEDAAGNDLIDTATGLPLAISQVNYPIDVATTGNTVTFTEDAGATSALFAATVDTVEAGDTVSQVVLTLANVETGDLLRFGASTVDLNTNGATGPDANGFTYTVSSAGASPVVTITHAGADDATVNTMLNSLVFNNTANDDPSTTARTVTLTSVTDSGSGLTANGTVATVNVAVADDALSVATTGNTVTFTEDAGATTALFAAAIDTVEAGDTISQVVLTLANVEAGDLLRFGATTVDLNTNGATGPDGSGFTYTVSSAGASPVVTVTHAGASDTATNAMLNSAVFDNTSNDDPSTTARTVTLTSVTDSGSGLTADGTVATVNVAAADDVLSVATTGDTVTFTEDAGATGALFAAAIDTVEAGDTVSQVVLTLANVEAGDLLRFGATTVDLNANGAAGPDANGFTYTVSSAGASPVVTISHAGASDTAANAMLNSAVFDNTSNDDPSTTARTVTLTSVTDSGSGLTADGTVATVNVAKADDALDVATTGNTVTFTEDAGATGALFAAAMDTVEAGDTISQVVLTLANVEAGDLLRFGATTVDLNTNGATGPDANGFTYTVSSAGASPVVTVTHAGASDTATNAMLNSAAFDNTSSDDPSTTARTVTLTSVTDSGSGLTADGTAATVNVATADDALSVATTGSTVLFTEDAGATGALFAAAIDTVEAGDTISQVVLTLANVEAGDLLRFGATTVDLNTNGATGPDANGFTYTVSSAGASPVVTITHAGASDTATNTMLNSAAFDNTSNDDPSTTARTVTLTSVTDSGSGLTADGTVATVNVATADDALDVATTGNTVTFTEDAGATSALFAAAIDTVEAGDTVSQLVLTLANVEAGDLLRFGATTVDLNANGATGPDASGFTYTVSSAGASPVVTITHAGASDTATNAMLNGAVFDNTSNDDPSTTARTVTLTSVTDSGSGLTADGTVATVNVAAADDVLSVATTGNTVTFTEDAGPTTALFAATIDTVEAGDTVSQLVLTLANVEAGDLLRFGATTVDLNANGATGPDANGFTYTVSSAGASPVVTITHAGASDTATNAMLNSAVFDNSANNDPSTTARTVTVTSVTDSGSGLTADGTVATVNVAKADDALDVATTGNTVTFTEDAGATTSLFAAAIDTIEAGDTVSQLVLTLANVEAGDLLRLGATTIDLNTNGATGPDGSGFTYTVSSAGASPVVTITHAGASDTATNAMLNSAVFDNTANNDPSTTARTVTLTSVTDSGSGLTADGTVGTVNVAKADDALDVATTGNTVTFTEDAGATTSLFAAAIDTVETGDTVSQVVLTLANVGAGDLLRFGATTVDLNANGATGPDANGFTYTVSGAGASPVVTTTHAGASDTATNAMLNSAVFDNISNDDPSTTARTVTLTSVTDSGSGLTADGTVATVNVATANDALDVATTGNTVTFTEDAGATTALFAAAIDTVEAGDTISQVVLTLANVEAGDLLRFGATTVDLNANGATGPDASGFTYIVSSAGASPVVTITHAGASDTAANAMLNSAVFDNTSNDNPSATARTVTLTSVTDSGSGLTADGTVATVNVATANDALDVATTGNTVTFTEDAGATTALFAAAIDTIEAGDTISQVVLTLANVEAGDLLRFGATTFDLNTNGATGPDANGFTYTVSSAGASPVVTITHAGASDTATNAMLNSAVFDNTSNDDPSTTARTVTLTSVTDSGSGLTADGTVATVNVAVADDALSVATTGNTVTFTEDAGATGALFAAAIDTVEAGDTISQVVLTLANVETGDLLRFGATTVDLNTNGATGPDANGFTYTVSSAGASPVVTITHAGASDTATNAMLNSAVFDNTSNDDPSTTARTVTLTSVTDSGSGISADGAVATVNVAKADDALDVATTGNTVTFTEDAGATTALFAATIDTVEAGDTISQVVLTLANVEVGDLLRFGATTVDLNTNGATGPDANGFTYTVSSAGASPVVTITHAGASDTATNTMLNSAVFDNTSNDDPSTTARTVTLTSVTDSGSGLTADGTVATVNVAAADDVLSVATTGDTVTFTEDAGATGALFAAAIDTVEAGDTVSQVVLTLANVEAGDLLRFGATTVDLNANGATGPDANGFTYTVSSAGASPVVTITHAGASDTATNAMLNSAVFDNTSNDDPSTTARTVTLTSVTDSGSGLTADGTVATVNVAVADDALNVATTGNTVTFTEDAGATSALFAATIDTVETGDTISQVVLTLANVETGDLLRFGATTVDLNANGATGPDASGFTYTVSSAGASPVVTITHAGASDTATNAMLNSAVFDNTSNDDPSTTARTVTLTSVTDSGSGLTADGTVATVNVAVADDALDVATTGNTVTFTEDAGATTSLFAAAIDTVEAGDAISQVVLTLANVETGDLLRFGATTVDLNTNGATGPDVTGFTYAVSSAGASPVVTITHAGADDATVNTMLNSLVFDNTSNDDPSTTARTVTLTSVTDSGSGLTADGTVATVNVAVADDALSVATTGNTVTFTEDAGATTSLFAAAIDSVEAGDTISQVVLTLANVEAGDLLRFGATTVDLSTNGATGPDANGFTYTVSGAGASPVVTITHAGASDTATSAMLNSAVFDNTSNDDPSTTARTVTLASVTDSGSGLTADGTVATVNVATANDALDVATTGNTVTFTEDAGATSALFAATIDTVETGDTISQVVLTLANVETGDLLRFGATTIDLNTNSATGPDANGFTYTVSSAGTSPVVTITHAGAGDATVNTMLNSLVFDNTTNDDPSTTARTVTLTSVTDSGSGLTADGTVATVNVSTADDALNVATTGNTVTFTEDAGATTSLFAAAIDTVETGDTVSQVVLTLANVEAGDLLRFGATTVDLNTNGATGPDASGFTYTVSSAGASPVVTITHAGASDTATNAMLNSAAFDNTSNDDPSTTARTVTLTSVTDSGSGLTADGTVATVNVSTADDALNVATTGNTVTFTEDAGATSSLFAAAIDTVEAGDTISQVVLTLANVESGDLLRFGATTVDLNANGATGPDASGFTYTVSSAGASSVVTITHAGAGDATVNTMLNSLVFDNTTNDDPSTTARTVTLTSVTDSGSGLTADGTVATVNVAKADDALDVATTGSTVLFTEDAGATGALFAAAIDTVEAGDTISQVVLTLANIEAGDLLRFGATTVDLNTDGATGPDANGFTYTVSSAGASPVVTISHAGASDTATNTMLNSLVFDNTSSDDPSATARTVTLTSVTDSGSGLTADGTAATVNVATADDALSVATTGSTVLFTEDAGATGALFAAAIDTVEAGDTISQVVLTLANVEAGDLLRFGATTVDLNTNGATGPDANGFTYTVSSAGTSPVVTITHAGAGDATVNTMLNSLVFDNSTNDDPSTTARTVTLASVTDSGSGLTADGTVATVNVVAVNDAATVSLSNVVTSLPEATSTATAIKIADIAVSDADAGVNSLTLVGADAAHFEIFGAELRLKAGTDLDFAFPADAGGNHVFDVTVEVDDPGVAGTPDGAITTTLTVTDVNEDTTGAGPPTAPPPGVPPSAPASADGPGGPEAPRTGVAESPEAATEHDVLNAQPAAASQPSTGSPLGPVGPDTTTDPSPELPAAANQEAAMPEADRGRAAGGREPISDLELPREVVAPEFLFVTAPQPLDAVLEGPATRETALNEGLREAMRSMRAEIAQAAREERRSEQVLDAAIRVAGVTTTVGSVAWLLRGGSLLASVLTTLPTWKGFDPLPVLAESRKERRIGMAKSDQEPQVEDEAEKRVGRVLDALDGSGAGDSTNEGDKVSA